MYGNILQPNTMQCSDVLNNIILIDAILWKKIKDIPGWAIIQRQ